MAFRVQQFVVQSLVTVAVLAGCGLCLRAQSGRSDVRVVDAAKRGDNAAIIGLLSQKADVNVPEADGTTAISWAVRRGDIENVDRLLRAGADVKAANRYGITPLYLAALNGDADIILKVLKAGAGANDAVTEGETALMTASRTGHLTAVKVLLEAGATVDAREHWRGQTALMWAAAEGHPAIIRELVAHGADVNAKSDLQKWERQVTAEPREKWLPPGGLTPIYFAARQGCSECIGVLASLKADVNFADQDGVTPLIDTLMNGHFDTASALLDAGADPNKADNVGRTPLYAAVDMNTVPSSNRPGPKTLDNRMTGLELVSKLLDKGANPNARLKKQTPYRSKVDRGTDTMLGAGTTAFLRAARAGDADMMRLLLKRGADPQIATGSDTPQDVNAGVQRRNPGGINPLMAAAGLGSKEEDTVGRKKTEADSIEAIKVCLEGGVNINAADGRGQTALYGAALMGYDEVVKFLLSRGADPKMKDQRGFTALDAAEGKAGGFGFGGGSSNPHPTTAKILRDAM